MSADVSMVTSVSMIRYHVSAGMSQGMSVSMHEDMSKGMSEGMINDASVSVSVCGDTHVV